MKIRKVFWNILVIVDILLISNSKFCGLNFIYGLVSYVFRFKDALRNKVSEENIENDF